MLQILSGIDTSEHGLAVMDYTVFIARALNARVTGLCVIETKKIEGPLLRDYLSTVGLDAGLDYKGTVARFLEMKSHELQTKFADKCREAGIEFEAVVEEGSLNKIIAARASDVDMILLGRKGEHAEWHARPLGGAVESVIRGTHKPIFITPRRFQSIDKALIAYDGSEHSKEALELAVRIHQRTRLRGVVLSIQSEENPDAESELRQEVESFLQPLDYDFEFQVRVGEAGSIIPRTAVECGCQLIIMGAYGHTKIREMILGSTTQEVLLNTPKMALLLRR